MRRNSSTPDFLAGAALALLLALAPRPGAAQSHDGGRVVEQLVNFVVTAEHVRHLTGGLNNAEQAIDPDCARVVPEELLAVQLVAPVELDIKSRPVAGTWQERWRVTACDETAIRNALFEVGEDGRIAMFPLAPGMTRLSPASQTDSVPLAIATVGNRLDGCTDVRLTDTTVPEIAGEAGAPDEAWEEHWTFAACDEIYRLTMQFSNAEDGPTGQPLAD